MSDQGFFSKLRRGLSKTSRNLTEEFSAENTAQPVKVADFLSEMEERLLIADVGIPTTNRILQMLEGKISTPTADEKTLLSALHGCLTEILAPCEQPLLLGRTKPFVILMVGVNGAGKTTSIGKIAKRLKRNRKSVLLAAGDTFRAAAVEQLIEWGNRNDVPVVNQSAGADSSAVIYDAFESARARGIDVLIADTAGRLHTQSNLMEELQKMRRTLSKLDVNAPHEILLVIEAATGQNALLQAREFNKALNITGLCITKLDGTAKGGVVLALADQLGLPIRYIGVGEGAEDLRGFDASEFAAALLNMDNPD